MEDLMRVLKAVCCAAAIVACLAPAARADEWNKKTYLTFSGPVQIPGATLPAGTYLFQLADPDTTRHVIMVRDKEGTKIYSMFMTIPNERLDTPDNNVVMFAERPAGTPQAIQAWWYPGDRIGEEFVYPKNQAVQIAKANRKAVLSTEAPASTTGSEADRAAMSGAKVGRVDETGQIASDQATSAAQPYKPSTTASAATTTERPAAAPANTVNGRNARSSKSTSVGTSGQAQTNTADTSVRRNTRNRLPGTASDLPLFELLSVVTLAGGLTLGRLRRWMA
jgi:hypothetical protein